MDGRGRLVGHTIGEVSSDELEQQVTKIERAG
jgi:hypothetical protein